jgi:hypothetical protein
MAKQRTTLDLLGKKDFQYLSGHGLQARPLDSTDISHWSVAELRSAIPNGWAQKVPDITDVDGGYNKSKIGRTLLQEILLRTNEEDKKKYHRESVLTSGHFSIFGKGSPEQASAEEGVDAETLGFQSHADANDVIKRMKDQIAGDLRTLKSLKAWWKEEGKHLAELFRPENYPAWNRMSKKGKKKLEKVLSKRTKMRVLERKLRVPLQAIKDKEIELSARRRTLRRATATTRSHSNSHSRSRTRRAP